jgi:signal transduction histidine kinase
VLRDALGDLEERVAQRTVELNEANQSLGELTARLLKLQDEERRRIARELHDSTGQELAFLSMNLHKLERDIEKISPEAAKEIAENYAVVQQIVSEVRTISHLLHPPLLDEIGLGFALQGYIDGFSERSNIKVHAEIPSELDRLGPELETAVFRVVQECLTNIHRHSGSPTASVHLDRSSTGINLEIKDEGKGIRSEKQPGVGLRGMTERVGQFGGTLEIISNETGTLVRAFFPVAVDGQPPSSERSSGKAAG